MKWIRRKADHRTPPPIQQGRYCADQGSFDNAVRDSQGVGEPDDLREPVYLKDDVDQLADMISVIREAGERARDYQNTEERIKLVPDK